MLVFGIDCAAGLIFSQRVEHVDLDRYCHHQQVVVLDHSQQTLLRIFRHETPEVGSSVFDLVLFVEFQHCNVFMQVNLRDKERVSLHLRAQILLARSGEVERVRFWRLVLRCKLLLLQLL